MKVWAVIFCVALSMGTLDAQAKRLGGGGSVGKQSSNVTQRSAAPAPTAPAQSQNAAAPAKPAPAAGAATTPAKKPWGAMLGGLAAGLGLAWLASTLGFGEAFGQFLLIALLVLAVMFVIGMLRRSRQTVQGGGHAYAFQGAGAAHDAVTPVSYRPENVGNDASARPFERASIPTPTPSAGSASGGIVIGSALPAGWTIPQGFDAETFLQAAKSNFILLQAAWDKSDMATLRSMMTDDMLAEISAQLSEREQHNAGAPNLTEVQMLQAQLLGIEELGGDYMASVEFSGMIREEPQMGPSPFREVWNMTKPKDGHRGWLVAGVQALQ